MLQDKCNEFEFNDKIKNNEDNRQRRLYYLGCYLMEKSTKINEYLKITNIFKSISNYKNSKELAERCLLIAENLRKNTIYNFAVQKMKYDTINNYKI